VHLARNDLLLSRLLLRLQEWDRVAAVRATMQLRTRELHILSILQPVLVPRKIHKPSMLFHPPASGTRVLMLW
jgi:hypothetical protein